MENESDIDGDGAHTDEEDWSQPVDTHDLPGKNANFTADQTVPLVRRDGVAGANDKRKNLTENSLLVSKLGHQRTIIHIDIDCFYAQVEMIRDPELRNKPLGIQQKYLVVTCNYVARELGVTKLMGIKEAKEKCPQLVLRSGEDLTHYREMSYKISECLQKYTPKVERLGFDENFIDVTEMIEQRIALNRYNRDVTGFIFGTEDDQQQKGTCQCGCHLRLAIGSQIAADIREALHLELGITCCAGIAHNKLLSKLVAGTHKPNKQTTIFPRDTQTLLASLAKARNIPGIGWTTAKKLAAVSIHSVVDVQMCTMDTLIEECGAVMAATIKQLSHGIDDSPVVQYSLPQSISDEDSFKKCATISQVQKKIEELLTNVLNRLVEDGRAPHTFRLTVRKFDGKKYSNRESRQCPVPPHIISKLSLGDVTVVHASLTKLAMTLFEKLVNTKQSFHLTLINVAFAKLEERTRNDISSFFKPCNSQKSPVVSPKRDIIQKNDIKQAKQTGHPDVNGVCEMSKSKLIDITVDKPRISLVLEHDESFAKETENLPVPECVKSESSNDVCEKEKCFVKELSPRKGDSDASRTNTRKTEKQSVSDPREKLFTDMSLVHCPKSEQYSIQSSDSIKDTPSLSVSNVQNIQEETKTPPCDESENKKQLLPKGIDPEVFGQLPLDMQNDILSDFRSTRSGLHGSESTQKQRGTRRARSSKRAHVGCATDDGPVFVSAKSLMSTPNDPGTSVQSLPTTPRSGDNLQLSTGSVESPDVSPFKKKKRLFSPRNKGVTADSNNNDSITGPVPADTATSVLAKTCSPLREGDFEHITLHRDDSMNVPSSKSRNCVTSCGLSETDRVDEKKLYFEGAECCLERPSSHDSALNMDLATDARKIQESVVEDFLLKELGHVPLMSSDLALESKSSTELSGVSIPEDESSLMPVAGPSPTVPPEMDPAVFRSLPRDIQTELSLQWQFEHLKKKNAGSPQSTSAKKRTQTSVKKQETTSSTLFNYFRSVNK